MITRSTQNIQKFGIVSAVPGKICYGVSIGILEHEVHQPFLPGDNLNMSTYPYPTRIKFMKGIKQADVLENKRSLLEDIIKYERELALEGVKAITTCCGYYGIFQKEMANAVEIPVFSSSLLIVPLLVSMLNENKKVGIVVASKKHLTDNLLDAVGINKTIMSRVKIIGLDQCEEFTRVVIGDQPVGDYDKIKTEVVQAVSEEFKGDNSIGIIHLECSDLPPYSVYIQKETNLPVSDWISFIDFVHDITVKKAYGGFM